MQILYSSYRVDREKTESPDAMAYAFSHAGRLDRGVPAKRLATYRQKPIVKRVSRRAKAVAAKVKSAKAAPVSKKGRGKK